MRETLRSLLVDEETDDYITMRAASDRGTVISAIGLWWTIWRHDWLPHRYFEYLDGSDFDLDQPDLKGWRWHNHRFWVRSAR